MFGLGMGEVLAICALGLVFVGPRKIPELARSLGRGLSEFRRAKDEILEELHREDHENRDQPNRQVELKKEELKEEES